jgi:carbamoyltransferase
LESCGKLMGMASWGRPSVGSVDGLRDLAREVFDDSTPTWLGYRTVPPRDVHDSVVRRFAVDPRKHDDSETLDLAASAQELFRHQLVTFAGAEMERIAHELAAHGLPAPRAMLYAGGCALSVVTNAALRKATGLAILAPPFSHDAGQFVGGAFYAALACNAEVPLGRGWPGLPNHTAGRIGPRDLAASGAELRPIALDEVAQRILAGELVACLGDGAEAGPRALGNRSLLANALDPAMRERLNDDVKKREWYRPFAPMLPAEAFPEHFGEAATPCARYMLDSFTLRPALRGVLSSVASPDGVSRAQAVAPDSSPWLYGLLNAIGAQGGRPVVLNTSLNAPGLPIAFDCAQVIDDARALGLDALVVREPASEGVVPRAFVTELRESACASAS